MIIGLNRIKYGSKEEQFSAIISNLLGLVVIFFGYMLYTSFNRIDLFLSFSAYFILVFNFLLSCLINMDHTSQKQHIGTNVWYASKINFSLGHESLISVSGMISSATFLFAMIGTIGELIQEGHFEYKYALIFLGSFCLFVYNFFAYYAINDKKMTEADIYLIDKVDVFDEDQKRYFKACMAEKIRKNGYLVRSDLYKVFSIIEKQYTKSLARAEKAEIIKKRKEEKIENQKDYQNLLNDFEKKDAIYIVKEKQ